MDTNPICHPFLAKKMKCSFLDYIQLLMIGRAGRWTRTPSTTSLLPKKWNACFWIMFNFWWSARLVNGLEPHLQPLSNQKYEMLVFGLRSTSDDQPGWSKDSNPICNLFPNNKMKCSFWYYVQFLMISRTGRWTQTPCHPSPTKKMKCLFLHYVQLLMIRWAGQWTRTSSATPLKPRKWNAHFCITFNFWWLARLVIGLKPHPPALSSQKKWNAHFCITFNFWWLARLAEGLKPHLQPLSNQTMKCLFLYYV